MLILYNSLTRKKEEFKPTDPGKIRIYVCGITVYDDCHLGHARSMVSFDVIVRYLRSQNYAVTYVRNITDIDDKIITRANERNITIQNLTEYYIQSMNEDTLRLNILPPDMEPRATTHIKPIIDLIERLIEKNHAYVADNGDVCFSVDSFSNYGKLSNKRLEDLIAGARIAVTSEKHSPLDFVLWKQSKQNEPAWDSPWGKGRPGWHIECSAMSMEELGENFDIHGGGLDLQFPHHENEIAQSEAASGKTFANYWLHVGLLQINNEKMAKSAGNFYTIKDVLKQHNPEVIRYFLLSSHYRSPLNYSKDNIQGANKSLTRLYQCLKEVPCTGNNQVNREWIKQFEKAMNDDFNTPIALSVLFQLSHEIHKSKDPILSNTLKKLGETLGILQLDPQDFLQFSAEEIDKAWVEQLIVERLSAKKEKNWSRADEIRQILSDKGIELADTSEGTTWRIN